MTTVATITRWFKTGVEDNKTHMAVFWDSFEGPFDADYPVYYDVNETPDIRTEVAKHGDVLQEVYDLRMDMDAQMSERRAFHY